MIIKPKNDSLQYCYYTLQNGLKCLLIKDISSNKSAISVNVSAGSFNEPSSLKGLAHLLEHMLFMGSKKYCKENYFHEYLSINNGSSNAYTGLTNTNYFYEIKKEKLEKSIDIFSRFFIDPLLNKNSLKREINAVHSEHIKNINNDKWRLYQMIFTLSNKYSKFDEMFPTGNIYTLLQNKVNVNILQEQLFKFYQEHYIVNSNLNLCLLSNHSFSTMKYFLNKSFNNIGIQNKKTKYIKYKDAYNSNNLCKIIKMKSIKNENKLIFQFHINENMTKYTYEKPLHIFQNIINSKITNSLYWYLSNLKLVNSIYCDFDNYCNIFTKVNIYIDLTQNGFDKYYDVINFVYHYIRNTLLKGISFEYIDTIQRMNIIDFNYQNKENSLSYVSDLSKRMSEVKEQNDILIEPFLYRNANANKVNALLRKYFHKNNLNVFVLSKNDFLEKRKICKEKYYGIEYTVDDLNIENDYINEKYLFQFPGKNKFIPNEINVKYNKEINGTNMNVPKCIYSNNNVKVFYKKDEQHNTPKIYSLLILGNDNNKNKSKISDEINNYIWNRIISNKLNDFLEMCRTAGITISLSLSNDSISILSNGYAQHYNDVLNEYINHLVKLSTNSKQIHFSLFERYFNVYKQNILNLKMNSPYIQALMYNNIILHKHKHPIHNILYYLSYTTPYDFYFKHFLPFLHKKLKSISSFKWLIQGNISKEKALSLHSQIFNILTSNNSFNSNINNNNFKINNNYFSIRRNCIFNYKCTNKNDNNNSLLSFYQYYHNNKNTYKQIILNQLLSNLLHEKYFDLLRTKYSLGYIVKLFPKEYNSSLFGINLLVQSNTKNPFQIKQYNKMFIKQCTHYIQTLTHNQLYKCVDSYKNKLMQMYDNIENEFDYNIKEVVTNKFDFNKKEKMIKQLHDVSLNDIQFSFRKIFINRDYQRMLSTQIFSYNEYEQYNKCMNSKYNYNDISLLRTHCLI